MMNEADDHHQPAAPTEAAGSAMLSPAGLARREVMLAHLLADFNHLHRMRRWRRHAVITSVALALVAGAAWWFIMSPGGATPTGRGPIVLGPPPASRSSDTTDEAVPSEHALIQIIQTDPRILDRYRAKVTLRVERIDDAGLLEALRAIDRPTGLVRIGDQAHLTSAVTDAELELAPPESPQRGEAFGGGA